MARVLVVGCGCRGRSLAAALRADGHAVRGTTRSAGRLAAIEAAGIEAVVADPDRLGTIMGQLAGVSVVCWLMGTATAAPAETESISAWCVEKSVATASPAPTATCAATSIAKVGAAALKTHPAASTASPNSNRSRRPSLPASVPIATAVHPAASPETDRSWPAVAVDTLKSRATSASTGEIAITAACPANRHRKSVSAGGVPTFAGRTVTMPARPRPGCPVAKRRHR